MAHVAVRFGLTTFSIHSGVDQHLHNTDVFFGDAELEFFGIGEVACVVAGVASDAKLPRDGLHHFTVFH